MFDMAALFRLEGLVGTSRDGYKPMSLNSSRMSSVITMSPWNNWYPSIKGEKSGHRSLSNELVLFLEVTTYMIRQAMKNNLLTHFQLRRRCAPPFLLEGKSDIRISSISRKPLGPSSSAVAMCIG